MRIRFLLGPAGTGKTRRCLDDIRDALRRDPDGPPLLLLAPKQSTFQLERALLEDDRLPGWSRLQILSFERLARQVLDGAGPVDLLPEEGRLMVLRSLLREHAPRLRVYHASARLTGFAQELSALLRELQGHQLGPDRLEALAGRLPAPGTLADKLRDFATLLRGYQARLDARGAVDADRIADLAAEVLRQGRTGFHLGGLWLDGFAEMTPQEMDLLAAATARSEHATLAFCADPESGSGEEPSWLSTWSVISQTYRRCRVRLEALPGAEVTQEWLPAAGPGRFRTRPALAHLAQAWSRPAPARGDAEAGAAETLRLVECQEPEHEALVAAREIRRHVRAGGRYRDVAVLLRTLDAEAPLWQRVFLRYDIPFFLDRRESLAHHPLAELTRGAVRLAAFDWPAEDWFGILKTGLTPVPPDRVDAWENLALARGWDGTVWRRLPEHPAPELAHTGTLLTDLVDPFRTFAAALGPRPSARILAAGLRQLWSRLEVRSRLDAWGRPPDPAAETEADRRIRAATQAFHRSAAEQLDAWVDSLELGFGEEALELGEWLPVIEAGLTALTAGVIPPAQDQVLIGAIDRSRQPELTLAIIAGLNEGRFPAAPRAGGLLSDIERDALVRAGAVLSPDRRRRVGHERYYGYIAFTRSGGRVTATWSRRDADGRALNPSPFVDLLRTLFPQVGTDTDAAEGVPPDLPAAELAVRAVHPGELVPWLLARPGPTELDGLEADPARRAWLRACRAADRPDRLAPAAVRALYGPVPEVTVSALQDLASCPFRFFAQHGLRGREREHLEADPRLTGTLSHQVLARFHEDLVREDLRWRDLRPDQARERVEAAARQVFADAAHGILDQTPEGRWQARRLATALAECAAVLVAWMASYRFDPYRAELEFGGGSPVPAWSPGGPAADGIRVRGKVDRVDLLRTEGGPLSFVILDYKLRPPRFDETLTAAGIDLQLAGYALALADLLPGLVGGDTGPGTPEPAVPAGMFFVGLRGRPPGAPRHEQPDPARARASIHVHRGRFDAAAAEDLDRTSRAGPSGQFVLAWNKDGSLRKKGDGRSAGDYRALLDEVRGRIRKLGELLASGEVRPDPYRHAGRTPCERCAARAVCRFDPWLQSFRSLAARD